MDAIVIMIISTCVVSSLMMCYLQGKACRNYRLNKRY